MNTPSIFSRLFETELAFKRISNHEEDYGSLEIVNEWIDLMEFIYLYGKTLKIEHINVSDLLYLDCGNHKLDDLRKIIEEDIKLSPFGHNAQITSLFLLEDDVIGGTSPMTILYVSPNTRRIFYEKYNYCGNSGNRLFHGEIVPLNNRGSEFQQFMYSYMLIHDIPDCIKSYIYNQLHDLVNEGRIIVHHDFAVKKLSQLSNIVDQNHDVINVGGLPLYYMSIEHLTANSDYRIETTKYNDDKLPLVLSHQGIQGANYLSGIHWIYGSVPVVPDGFPLEERILPLTRFKYPFLIAEDFLEEKLIGLPRGVNDKYLTCGNDESRYLLPLKPIFFQYFEIADIERILSFDTSRSAISLMIPVKGGSIELRKEYHDDNIIYPDVDLFQKNICVTPFYTISGVNNEEHYIQSIYPEPENESQLVFINSDTSEVIPVEQHRDNSITSYKTERKWDIIRVTKGEFHGILIPNFQKIFAYNNNQIQFNVCIGDSYTTIMHSQGGNPQPLEFDCHKSYTEPLFSSEFAIDFLRANGIFALKPNECLCSPYTSMTVNKQIPTDFQSSHSFGYGIVSNIQDLAMFGQRNVGIQENILCCLRTRNGLTNLRMYCEQLVIMMKTEAALQYNSNTFNIDVVMPDWLTMSEKSEYEHIWKCALDSHLKNGYNIHFSSKADTIINQTLAVYGLGATPVLNIHIDTHHTDITFHEINGKRLAMCVPFGSGDLFSDNFSSIIRENAYENVYIHYLQEHANTSNLQSILINLLERHTSTETIIQVIKELDNRITILNEEFHQIPKSIFILALSYYINIVIAKFNLRIPSEIVFSGIGVKDLSFSMCEMNVFYDALKLLDNRWNYSRIPVIMRNPLSNTSFNPLQNNLLCEDDHVCVYGLRDENRYFDMMTWGEIEQHIDNLRVSFLDFNQFINTPNIQNLVDAQMGVRLDHNAFILRHIFERNIDRVHFNIREIIGTLNNSDTLCKDSPFFLMLKGVLYPLSKEMWNKQH